MEVNTVLLGKVKDFFDNAQPILSNLPRAQVAETRVFGGVGFTPGNVKVLPVKSGDLNLLFRQDLGEAAELDYLLVFGSFYVKGWLVQELAQKGAVDIDMGLPSCYCGLSCNFWALDDEAASLGRSYRLFAF